MFYGNKIRYAILESPSNLGFRVGLGEFELGKGWNDDDEK